MSILAIDVGKKRWGLAWCEPGLGIVLPFGVVASVDEVRDIIAKEKITQVVIGLPLDLSAGETEWVSEVRAIGAQLATVAPVEFVDERFSTAAAARMGAEGASRDEKAAMIILQSYLDQR